MELKRLKFIDRSFVTALFALIVFGLVVVFSATANSGSSVTRQIAAVFIGLTAAVFVVRYDYIQIKRYSWMLYGAAIVLLILVLLLGDEVNGTQGWIKLGPLGNFQPPSLQKYCSFWHLLIS
jgi:rod shape determining protein RodA